MPYHPSVENPYRRGGLHLVELPIALSPWLRLPLIGTSFVMAAGRTAGVLHSMAAGRSFLNLEFHGIDFVGCDETGSLPSKARQPDAKIPLDVKLERISLLLDRLHGRNFVTLSKAALT